MPTAIPPPILKTTLGDELRAVARHLRAVSLHRCSIRRWLIIGVLAFIVLELRANVPEFGGYAFPVLWLLVLGGIIHTIIVYRRTPYDYLEAARIIEGKFPELKQALRTAAEQMPDKAGHFNFLQLRVIGTALQHANVHEWTKQPRRRAHLYFAAHTAALAVALALTAGPLLMVLANREFPVPQLLNPPTAINITPGNADIERGHSVVIAARFDGRIPRQTELVWTRPDGKTSRSSMERSLTDPVFYFTLPGVMENVNYTVVHDGDSTESYVLKVFDRPALLHANATLDYPSYTGQEKRTIPDTYRVSAITGTKLDYELVMNKPVKDAVLQDEAGNKIPLTPADAEHTRFNFSLTIEESKRLALRLTDMDNRDGVRPADFRIEALASRRPVVRVTFPGRDVRVSPIEEIHLQGQVRSQFNLADYGLAYSIGAGDPQFISLRPGNTTGNTTAPLLAANFTQTVDLESRGVGVGELVTWFAWADDTGPDGKPRRTTSDLFYAEVRPFETIYREDAQGGAQAERQQGQRGQQGGQQGGNQDLIELQQQISLAIWNLKQQDAIGANFTADVSTLKESQQEALEMLSTAAENANSARAQAAAQDAEKFMKQALQNLGTAEDKKAMDALTPAWSGAQGAYQALLRMQQREFRVSQVRQQGQQGQQRNQRNQEQLNQLRFRQQENRYQTENTAQDPTSPEQRDQMQAQSRLRELARRQQDLNERLQELQTALAAAQDQARREEIQRELRRLEEDQRNLLADLDDTRQQLDRLQQQGQQNAQAQQQLEQARNDMRQAQQQLAQNQVSQALASGSRASQEVQQGEQAMRGDTSSRFAEQMSTARQEARQLDTRQEEAGKQIEQLAQAARTLDDSAERQALSQTYTQQRTELNQLTEQLRQITEDSEATEPGLHRQLYDLLREQARATTPEDLRNGAQLLRNGLVNQARPLQTNIAQNLDQLRQGVERAASSVLGNDSAAIRYAQNELNDLTQQVMREAPTTDQFRTDPNAQNAQGQNGQGQQGEQQTGQPGQNGQPGQQGQAQTGDQFAQNGQPGQQGQNGQQPGQGQQGQRGQPGQGNQPGQRGQGQTGDQFAQNGEQGQAQGQGQNGEQPGQGQQASNQPGNRQGRGQNGQQPGEGQGQGQGEQLAQNGQGQRGQGQGQGRQGQGQNGQQPGGLGDGQQLAQNGQGQRGQGQGQGQQGQQGQRGQGRGQGQGQGQGGQGGQGGNQQGGDQLAQNDGQNQGGLLGNDQFVLDAGNFQPGDGRAGNRGNRGGNRGGNVARNGGPGGFRDGGGGNNFGGNYNGGDYYNGGAYADNYIGGNEYTGPITGGNFTAWSERLRTVENLVDDPQLRQQIANARAQAEEMRRNFQRHSEPPKWDLVMSNVISPLNNVRAQLRQELARREQPDALQPVDQDPVPDKYADSVKKYYESLGSQEPLKN